LLEATNPEYDHRIGIEKKKERIQGFKSGPVKRKKREITG